MEKLLKKIERKVRKKLQNSDGCHDFDHTLRVYHNAELLLEKIPRADRDIVLLAVLLHDIARPEEQEKKGRVCHAKLGAEQAEKLLKNLRLKKSLIQQVSDAVRTHRYRDDLAPQTIEAQIVYDADKLDSLGAVGIGRAFLFAGKQGAKLHNTELEAVSHRAYTKEDTAYREYLVKLKKLPGAMLTEPGRLIAAERLAFMTAFFEQLNREVFPEEPL